MKKSSSKHKVVKQRRSRSTSRDRRDASSDDDSDSDTTIDERRRVSLGSFFLVFVCLIYSLPVCVFVCVYKPLSYSPHHHRKSSKVLRNSYIRI